MPILASRLTSGARFFHDREGICPHFGDKILRDHGNDSAVGHSGAMSYDIPGAAAPIAQSQSGAVSRQQLLRAGIASKLINARLKRGRWQQLHWGVYAVFTGPVPRETELWAVLLRAGPGAALSHLTAAELHGLVDFPGESIHVMVPSTRRVTMHGVVVRTSARIAEATHPVANHPGQLSRRPSST